MHQRRRWQISLAENPSQAFIDPGLKRRFQMTFEITSVRRVVLLGALAFGAFPAITRSAAGQTRPPVLLIALKAESSLAIFDPVSGKVVGRVPTGEVPHMVAASADGKLAFATAQKGDAISVIDMVARKEVRRVKIGPGSRPHGIYVAAGKVYFTEDGYKIIGCYNPASDQIEWLLGIGRDVQDQMLVVSKDANKIFTANNASDSITALERVLDPPDWRITMIPVAKGPQVIGIDISPDSKEVWTAHQGDNGISIIDVATLKVTQTLPVKMVDAHRVKFTPDGKRVLITDRRGNELVVLDAAARKEIKRVKLDTIPTEIQVVPDGSRAYVSSASGDNATNIVSIVDLKTLQVTGQFSPGTHPEGMAWLETR
jgi:YVTN family beta-propeller protein